MKSKRDQLEREIDQLHQSLQHLLPEFEYYQTQLQDWCLATQGEHTWVEQNFPEYTSLQCGGCGRERVSDRRHLRTTCAPWKRFRTCTLCGIFQRKVYIVYKEGGKPAVEHPSWVCDAVFGTGVPAVYQPPRPDQAIVLYTSSTVNPIVPYVRLELTPAP